MEELCLAAKKVILDGGETIPWTTTEDKENNIFGGKKHFVKLNCQLFVHSEDVLLF